VGLRIAVLDRDSGFIQVLSKRVDRLGWEHRVLASPVPSDAVVSMRLSALVVDLAVLGPQAWSWLERLCEAVPELGIVVCTGPSTVAQRVRGLRLGADDWITKPCHPEEVIARVQSVVRRRRRTANRAEVPPVLAGEVEIRPDRFQAFVGAESIDLTRREFELIELLASAEGRVLEREEIYSRLWGYTMVRGDRSVDVFVRKLRQKLEKVSPNWRYIHTHFGIGYRFAAESLEVIDPSDVPSALPAAWAADDAEAALAPKPAAVRD
jgi:DNA-binding response OmpR family regulator